MSTTYPQADHPMRAVWEAGPWEKIPSHDRKWIIDQMGKWSA